MYLEQRDKKKHPKKDKNTKKKQVEKRKRRKEKRKENGIYITECKTKRQGKNPIERQENLIYFGLDFYRSLES